jgi:hypothetical protein
VDGLPSDERRGLSPPCGSAGVKPAARPWWRTETVFFLGLLAAFLWILQTNAFRDPGTFWHTVVGERILSTGRVVQTDSFSFTFTGRPWIAQQWLCECVMALLARLSGLDGLLLATATLLAAAYTWVARRLLRAGVHWSLAVLVVLLVFFASAYHYHARPHLVTILLLGWAFARLSDFEAGRLRLAQLFWLIPLFVLWTNLHGGMLGGLATLGLAAVGWLVLYLLHQESPLRCARQILWLVALVVACGLTALVNPYGVRLLHVWVYLSGPSVLPQYILEHMPLNPREFGGRCVLFFGAIYVGVLLTALPHRPRVTWLIPLVWFGLACKSIRHGPLFAITAGMALADIIPHTRWARWLAREGTFLYRERPPVPVQWPAWRPVVVPVAVLLTAVALQVGGVPAPLIGKGWARLDPNYWPIDCLPELRALPDGTHVFNDMLFGGFLIAEAPNVRVFIDDRCELYGDDPSRPPPQREAFLRDYFEAERSHPERIEAWSRQYRFDWALVRRGADSGFDDYLRRSSDWTAVCTTEAAVLYRRSTP